MAKWAKSNGAWFEDTGVLGKFSDRGSENEVYVSSSGKTMFKLNDFRYSDDNLTAFFNRLEAHNHYFQSEIFSCLTKRAFFVSTLDETTGAHDGHRNTPKTDVPDIG